MVPATYTSTLQQVAGTIQVDAGGSLDIDALRQFQADTVLDLETGSTLTAAGRPSTQLTSDGTIALSSGGNRFALSLQGTTTIDDATVDAGPGQPMSAEGGSILIGQDGAGTPASVLAEDGATVTDTYAILFSSPTSYGTLTITGPTTVWTDAGDPSDTEQTRGYMLIGDNEQANNTPTPPYLASASLLVTDGATLDEAAYANIGNSIDSSGSVDISGATWNIGNTGTTGTPLGFLQVGHYGTGSLTIDSGSTVSIGAGGTIVNDGTTEAVNFAVEIGHYTGASGTLTLEGTGSQLNTLNALLDGESGTGSFTVETDASASIDGNIDLGGNSQGSQGGSGQLFVDTGGRIEQGQSTALALWSGSTVSVDSTSAIDVGNSGTFIDGSIHVDSGSGLRGDGSVAASVDNDGAIHATNNGTYDLSTGGLLDITGNVTGSGTSHVSPGATLEIDGTIAASQFITFDSGPGGTAGLPETLILTTPGTGLSNSVTNLQDFDKIEFGGLTITGVTYSAGTVTVTTTGLDYKLTDVAFQSGASHNFTYGHDGTTDNDYIQVTCFAAGTRIATPRGDVAVESLCIGEPVLTVVGGRPQPIAWIGRRRIDCRRHYRPASVWPVRIRQAAFGPGLPARDLFVSPDHALFIDGVLIPAKYLLNGTSVAQVPLDTVTYYHIELPRHDVVLAEGLPAESYLDTDDRATFDNGGHVTRLHPDLSSLLWEAKGCAPLVITGPALAAAHARLGQIPHAA
jgi:collagen type I/II/III/V/XI/XXIV/XXVII alpha